MASPEMEDVGEDHASVEPVDTTATDGQEPPEDDEYREVTNVQTIPTKIDDGHRVDDDGSRPGSAGSAVSMAQTDPETQEVINKCAIHVKSESQSRAEHAELQEATLIGRPASPGLESNSGFQWSKAKGPHTKGNQQGSIFTQHLAQSPAIKAPGSVHCIP